MFFFGTSRALTEGIDKTPQHMQASMTTLFFMRPDIPRCVKIRARLHQINDTTWIILQRRHTRLSNWTLNCTIVFENGGTRLIRHALTSFDKIPADSQILKQSKFVAGCGSWDGSWEYMYSIVIKFCIRKF